MLWFTETFETSHGTFSAVLVQAPFWLAMGVVQDGFAHDWDEDKVPQVVLFGAAAGLLMVMPLGQVIVGGLMAGGMGLFSWVYTEIGLRRCARVEAGRLVREPARPCRPWPGA